MYQGEILCFVFLGLLVMQRGHLQNQLVIEPYFTFHIFPLSLRVILIVHNCSPSMQQKSSLREHRREGLFPSR